MALVVFEEYIGLITAFAAASIPYATIGALALAVHGAPRATTDIDLLIEPERLDDALSVARECGFTVKAHPMTFSDGMQLQRVSKFLGKEHLILDLLLVNETTRPAWESRQTLQSERGAVTVIGREALIAMKAAAGRDRDLADIERLREQDR